MKEREVPYRDSSQYRKTAKLLGDSPLLAHPEFRSAHELQLELDAKRSDARQRQIEAWSRMHEDPAKHGGDARRDAAVAKLLGKGTPESPGAAAREYGAAQQDEADVDAAIARHSPTLAALRLEAERQARAKVLKEHQAVAGRIATAAKQLREALRDERLFQLALEDASIEFGYPLQPAVLAFGGSREDSSHFIDNWLAEMRALNYIDA